MALSHSPNISANGIIAYYDTYNTKKSWLGDPVNFAFPSKAYVTTGWSSATTGFSGVCSASTKLAELKGPLYYCGYRIITTGAASATVTPIPFSMRGRTGSGWSVAYEGNDDDRADFVPFPWAVTYLGVSYNQTYVGSNYYLTFGGSSTEFSGLNAFTPGYPKIMVNAGDRSAQYVAYVTEGTTPNRVFRIRFEGGIYTEGNSEGVMEYLFYENARNQIDLLIGRNGQTQEATYSGIDNFPRTENYAVAPDGTQTATRYTWNSLGNGQQYTTEFANVAALNFSTYTGSLYIKGNSNTNINLEIGSGVSFDAGTYMQTKLIARCKYNTGTSRVVNIDASDVTNISTSVTPAGNNWFRVSLTGTFLNEITGQVGVRITTDRWDQGDVSVWGVQFQPGSLATPLITTTNAASSPIVGGNGSVSGRLFDIVNNSNMYYNNKLNVGEFLTANNSRIGITPNVSSAGSNSFSIECWTKIISFSSSGGSNNAICLYGVYNTSGFRLGMQTPTGTTSDTVGTLNFWTTESGGNISLNSAPQNAIQLNTQYHFVTTYNSISQLAVIYVNGIAVSSARGTYIAPAAGNEVLVGGGLFGMKCINGSIDNFKMYNRSLTATEVSQNYSAHKGRYGVTETNTVSLSGLVLHLDAADPTSYPGTGTIWRDLSGQGNHVTLVVPPVYSPNGHFNFNGTNTYASAISTTSLTTTTPTIIIACTGGTGTAIAKGGYGSYFNYGLQNIYSTQFTLMNHNGSPASPSYGSVSGMNIYAGIWDGTNYNFYLNGISIGQSSTNYSPLARNELFLRIGCTYSYTGGYGTNTNVEFFTGNIAMIQVYNRPLTSIEVLQVTNMYKGRYGL